MCPPLATVLKSFLSLDMFGKAKRFEKLVPQAPPVGLYNVVSAEKKGSGPASFLRSKRFDESEDSGPGPADMSTVSLDSSTCSISNKSNSKLDTSVFLSPLPVKRLNKGFSSSTPELSSNGGDLQKELHKVIQEKVELESQLALALWDIEKRKAELKTILQEKSGLETAVASLQKEIRDLNRANELLENEGKSTTNDKTDDLECELSNARKELKAKEKELVSLQLQLDCKVESVMADLDLEKSRNAALNERITSLEQTTTEIRHDRDLVESDNHKLHEMAALLREENITLREKVEETEQELDAYHAKIESAVLEGERKIAALQDTLSNEIKKTEAEKERLENMLKSSEHNVLTAGQRVEELNDLNSNLGEKVEDLEEKLKEGKHAAQEEIRSLVAEKTALESQLQTCHVESEEKLHVANDQVESMKRELKRNEEIMTNSLRALTEKYESLEESFANAAAEHDQSCRILTTELEATKRAAQDRKTECDQLHRTLVSLNEQLGVERKDKEELKEEMLSAQDEATFFEEKLSQVLQEAEETKEDLTRELAESHETISSLVQGNNVLSRELDARGSQEEKLSAVEKELKRVKEEAAGMKEKLQADAERRTSQVEEREKKVKEEFGRRLMETQKKLSQAEMSFRSFKEEKESELKHVKEEYGRKLLATEKELEELRQKSNRESDENLIENLNSQIQMWQAKCASLEEIIEPFKDQQNGFEAERKALLCQNTEAHSEVSKLSLQYAKLLGHQNQKQKIHHVMKLKEEGLKLKTENSKLREQCDKQKRTISRLEERVNQLAGKKKFNPAEGAFSHSTKENMPLSLISGGNETA